MVLKEFLGLIDLFEAQILCIYEVVKIVMICKDKNLMYIIF